jgi:hypothetical protein
MTLCNRLLLTSAILAASAVTASAATVLGLSGDKTLVMFDSAKPQVSSSMDITGVDELVGIDYRPGNGTVIGVTPDSSIVTIDLKTGAATPVGKMDKPMTMADSAVVVDFNPMADRLRYMTGTTNHRVHPDTGAVTVDGNLAFEDGDANKGATPKIAAAAYINSYGKPEATKMFNIDAGLGALLQQTKPNDGTLKTIGALGISSVPESVAFDIQTTSDGINTAWLVAGDKLYTVNLETGAATEAGTITGAPAAITDIAVLPAM